eukprot:SAG31_NODE_10492_length_1132_cov_1.248790_2_plen_107_part_00
MVCGRLSLVDQGESNIGSGTKPGADHYRMHAQELVSGWRTAFGLSSECGWFGIVQIAGCRYADKGKDGLPDVKQSHATGDLRQAQLAALALPNVGLSTAIDTGDCT